MHTLVRHVFDDVLFCRRGLWETLCSVDEATSSILRVIFLAEYLTKDLFGAFSVATMMFYVWVLLIIQICVAPLKCS